MCVILGVIVVKENEEVEDESAKVIVSNHVSLLDHMAIHLLRNSFSISLSDLPSFFHHALNYMDVGNCQNQEALVRNVKNYLSADATIDVQAEMGITSGQKGLLRCVTYYNPVNIIKKFYFILILIIKIFSGFLCGLVNCHA